MRIGKEIQRSSSEEPRKNEATPLPYIVRVYRNVPPCSLYANLRAPLLQRYASAVPLPRLVLGTIKAGADVDISTD